MKVRMRTRYATEVQTAQPGEVIDVAQAESEALIAGRYAEPVDANPASTPSAAPETPPATAQTDEPKTPRRGRGGRSR